MRRTVLAFLTMTGLATAGPISFPRDIETIITRQGCNDNRCHGGVKGRGGLRLSPEMRDPRQDYRWIVKGGQYQVLTLEVKPPIVPRVNLKEPEKSLLLLKPTMSAPHGGGRRFKVDSPEYRTLLEWIRQGAPYGPDISAVKSLSVEPGELYLDAGQTGELKVFANRADGVREDVTARVRFETNLPEVARVTPDGVLEALKPGETAVVVHGLTQIATALVAVRGGHLEHYPALETRNYIDRFVQAKLRKLELVPSPPASDEEFLRRVCLDIAGTLPPPNRVREFLSSKDPAKRDKLIEVLLASPQYVDLWTLRFADLFRIGGGPKQLNYWDWLRDAIQRNRPYDQIARERIGAQGFDGSAQHFGPAKPTPIERAVSEEVRIFLSRRLDCAQCHNHPYDQWTQDQFWGLAAFFGRMTWTNWAAVQVLYDDPKGNEVDLDDMNATSLQFLKPTHPRTKKPVEPTFLDGTPLDAARRGDPREALAEWMTAHPYFAEETVNRIWSYFFGRGLVDPPDDFRSNNPATHPRLLAALAEDFRTHGHDLKRLMRQIVQSRTYQTSGMPTGANKDDELNYAWAHPRPLDAEVLLDAVSSVSGVPETFRAPDDGGQMPRGTRAIQMMYPAGWENRFLEVFGCPSRDTIPERTNKPNLTQALHEMAGSTFSAKIARPEGRLHRLIEGGATDRAIIEELFLSAFARLPAKAERSGIEQRIAASTHREQAFEDLLWSLLSSREFGYNH